MFPEFDLSQLPFQYLAQRDSLPDCPAIYFAIDSNQRVLYVGKAIKLLTRWKNHHRFEHLNKLNRKSPIKLAWMVCPNDPDLLSKAESYFIDFYQPLLNQTPVPARKIIPAEVVLQPTLTKLSKYVVIFGVATAQDSGIPTVYIKYDWLYRSPIRTIRSIFKADNKKPTGLRWSEYCRRQYSFWKATCNGVAIDIAPWDGILYLRNKAVIQKLAGVEMLALRDPEFTNIKNSSLKEQLPRLAILEHDPIPLLWLQ